MARNKAWWVPYLFLAIPLAMFLMWVIGPMIYSFYLSLTNWDGVSAPNFIGMRNYVRLFDDRIFWISTAQQRQVGCLLHHRAGDHRAWRWP